MKEHEFEINQNQQNPLTNQVNLSRLESEGNIFMPEAGEGLPTREEAESVGRESTINSRQVNASSEAEDARIRSVLSGLGVTDEQEKEMRQGIKETKRTRDQINEALDNIKKAETIDVAKARMEQFFTFVRFTEQIAGSEYQRYSQEMNDIMALSNKDELLVRLDALSKEVKKHYAEAVPEAPDVPESLEDLAALIIRTGAEEWRTGHEHELINENGELVKENFLRWVRSRIYAIHDFNPTSEVNFFSEVSVITKSGYRTISLSEMVFTPSFFAEKRKEKVIYGYDENGNPKIRETTKFHRNEDYEALRSQLVTETFLFQASRNFHVQYEQKRGSEKQLTELLGQIYSTNVFTRGNFLESILSMPSMEKEDLTKGREIKEKQDKNFKVGDAVRRAILSYYYIHDYETLEKVLGRDAILFKKHYKDIDGSTGRVKADEASGRAVLRSGEKNQGYKDEWFNGENVAIDPATGKPNSEFMNYINVFLGPMKDERIIKETRERIVQSLMEASGLNYEEARYAEAWAFSMTRWTGLGAKNDTNAVGYDAWTKVQNTMYYRLRQADKARNALSGNPFNMGGFKRLGLNFFEGITDTGHKRTILERIQGGQGEHIDLAKSIKNAEDPLVIDSDAMRQFAVNHIQNGFAILEFLIDYNELNFQNFTKIDSMGRTVIDYEKANKIVGGIEKAIRYAYSTWAGTNYGSEIRTWEKIDEKIVAKELSVASMLFGPEILKLLRKTIERTERDKNEKINVDEHNIWNIPDVGEIDFAKLQSKEIRHVLWKEIFKYAIEKEIESHRYIKSPMERFNFSTLEKIYAYLEAQGGAFTKEDIDDIRKDTKTEMGRMLSIEGTTSIFGGGFKGFLKSLRVAIAQLSK